MAGDFANKTIAPEVARPDGFVDGFDGLVCKAPNGLVLGVGRFARLFASNAAVQLGSSGLEGENLKDGVGIADLFQVFPEALRVLVVNLVVEGYFDQLGSV